MGMPKDWLVQSAIPEPTYKDVKIFAATMGLSVKASVTELVTQAIAAWKAQKS